MRSRNSQRRFFEKRWIRGRLGDDGNGLPSEVTLCHTSHNFSYRKMALSLGGETFGLRFNEVEELMPAFDLGMRGGSIERRFHAVVPYGAHARIECPGNVG